jgi:hypothetical protein
MVSSLITQLGLLRPMERAANVWQGECDAQQVAETPDSTLRRLPGALRIDFSGGTAMFRHPCLKGLSSPPKRQATLHQPGTAQRKATTPSRKTRPGRYPSRTRIPAQAAPGYHSGPVRRQWTHDPQEKQCEN